MLQDLTVNGTKETGTKIELFSEDPDSGRKGSAGPVGKLMLLKANRSLHAPLTQVQAPTTPNFQTDV